MSQDAGREKVFQTTKVRTSIKSDLSWIQKMKEAENIKESRDPPEERTPTLSRQLSYVLMTAKKFEPDTSPEKEIQIGKHSVPVSSEPTAVNDVDLKSNDSAEVSKVDVKENSEETKLETVIENDPTAVEGSAANMVPDIIAESVSKSSPQENGNDLSTENAFDNLYDSLVEPINPIHLDAVEAQKTPASSALIDEPQDDTATNTNQSTKECETVNGDVHVQNDEEAFKSEEKEREQPEEQDVSTTFTEIPKDSSETTETHSTSAKLAIEECETTNNEVTELKTSDVKDVPSDAPLADSQPQSQDLPSTNGDTSMIVYNTDAQDNVNPSHTEEALSESKETIVDEISTGQESKSVEVVVVALPTSTEEESTIKAEVVVSETATAVVDPDKSNEADLKLDKEIVDDKSAAESVVSESVETKSQTETHTGSVIGKHSEPASANDVDLKSNDSAEVSSVDVKENSEEFKLETVIVKDPTAVEGSAANMVPDIIAESVSKSSPQENGNDLSTENAFDNLYNSLVEPINPIHLDAVEAQKTPASSALIDEPQDDTATNTNQSTKECETVNGDVHVQNDEEAVKSEEKEREQPKEQDVSTTFTEIPKGSSETTETHSTSAKLAIEECETTNDEVTEQKQSDVKDVPSDAPLADSQPQSQDLPSTNGDTSMIVDNTNAQDNVNPSHTEEALSESKETIVDEISTGQESKSVEVVVVALPTSTEEESTIKAEVVVSETATAVVDPDKSNEADLMLDKEIVDDKSAAESVVSESVETKSQTETKNGSMIETVAITPKENVVSLDKEDVRTPIETPEVIQESAEIAVQSAGDGQPAMVDVNPEEIFKAEPVVVVPSTCEAEESGLLEKEVTEENISEEATEIEPIPLVPSVAGENQTVFDLSNALEIVPTSESNEEAGKMEITSANDEATDVKTVKESEEPANKNGDGQEVCSQCDQFIGQVKLIIEYPPMYLHPECLTCGKCTQNLGNLLIPMFEHNHLIYCSDCYDVVYTL